MHNSLLHLLLKNCDFLNTDISQGSVVTRLGCGGVFVYCYICIFVTNFLLSLTVKEFWKSTNIWWSYGQELDVLFFLTHGVHTNIYVIILEFFVIFWSLKTDFPIQRQQKTTVHFMSKQKHYFMFLNVSIGSKNVYSSALYFVVKLNVRYYYHFYYHLLCHMGSPHTHNSIQPHTSTYTKLHTKIYKNIEKD